MEWILSILIMINAVLICAAGLFACRQWIQDARQRELLRRLHDLESVVSKQQQQIDLLETKFQSTRLDDARRPVHEALALIEELSDMAAMQNEQSLPDAAKACRLPAGVAVDLFEADHKLLAISHLLDQGNSLAEVAARLNLPLGEVELLANTRS